LQETIRIAATVSEPILECGSGLTTILLGLFAGQRDIQVWTLEHEASWYKRVSTLLKKYNIPNVELCLVPLRDYEGFCWYAPPLHRMPKHFSLAVCDGPPQKTTPGGRYGLLPVMRERLRSGTVILLDDVGAMAYDNALSYWQKEILAKVEVRGNQTSDAFAVILLE
jgi:hypothetical protein